MRWERKIELDEKDGLELRERGEERESLTNDT